MTNLKEAETWFTIRDSRTINGTKCGDWHGNKRRDRKVRHMTLSNTSMIEYRLV